MPVLCCLHCTDCCELMVQEREVLLQTSMWLPELLLCCMCLCCTPVHP